MDSIKCEAYLLAIEQGSLTAAGQILGYTQPGITRMIHALEDECGFILLSRTVKGVAATENGKRLLPYFREIVRAQKNALEASQEIQGLHSGVLSIGSYYSVSAMLLPHILYKFSKVYPGIRIKLREGSNRDMAGWLINPLTVAMLPKLCRTGNMTGYLCWRMNWSCGCRLTIRALTMLPIPWRHWRGSRLSLRCPSRIRILIDFCMIIMCNRIYDFPRLMPILLGRW